MILIIHVTKSYRHTQNLNHDTIPLYMYHSNYSCNQKLETHTKLKSWHKTFATTVLSFNVGTHISTTSGCLAQCACLLFVIL